MSLEVVPRRRWPWIVVAILVVAAVAVLLVLHFAGGTTAEPTSPPTAQRSASQGSPVTDPAPTGCLGGSARDASMVLSAEKLAPHTTNGAIEVAASFTRWIQRFPYPKGQDVALISSDVLAKKSFTSDLAAYLSKSPDLSGGIVTRGETYYMSTIPGVWNLESAAANKVVVTIGTAFVVKGVMSPTLKSSITITLNWEDGDWRVANAEGTRTTEQLFSVGHPFMAGC